MRSERFQRLRRHAERDHDAAVREARTSHFNPATPWNTVFAMAVADKTWWEENLHRAVLLYLSRVRSAAQILDDRTAQPSIDLPGSRASASATYRPPGDFGPRARSRTPPRASRDRPRSPRKGAGASEAVYTKKGKKFCDPYNTPGGCSAGNACKEVHACKLCRRFGHPMQRCDPSKAGPGPPQGGRQRNGAARGSR